MTTHTGSCHCGAVRYQLNLDLEGKATRCNCTMCTKLGNTGITTKPANFTLLQGEDVLGTYAKHPEIARRHFCTRCGIHCFSRGNLPEIGGEFVGVAINTLDDLDLATLTISYWDGRHDNWQSGLRDKPWPTA